MLAPVSKSTLLDGPGRCTNTPVGTTKNVRPVAPYTVASGRDQGDTVRGFSRPGHGDAEVAQEVEHFSGGGGRTGSGSGTGEAASSAIRRARHFGHPRPGALAERAHAVPRGRPTRLLRCRMRLASHVVKTATGVFPGYTSRGDEAKWLPRSSSVP